MLGVRYFLFSGSERKVKLQIFFITTTQAYQMLDSLKLSDVRETAAAESMRMKVCVTKWVY